MKLEKMGGNDSGLRSCEANSIIHLRGEPMTKDNVSNSPLR